VATDGGRLNQQFCFAHVEGKLIVTTTEGLMIRTVANAKAAGADSLSSDVIALAEQAAGFTAHDITMWLDQSRLNRNRYFENYWIHHNAEGALANIESGLIDLRITREGMNEQRWFRMGSGNPASSAIPGEQVAAFMRFAPADAQLVHVKAAAGTEHLSSAIEGSLFGKLPDETWSPAEIPDRTRSDGNEGEHIRAERYNRLDSRFDIDVDDAQAPRRKAEGGSQEVEKKKPTEPAASEFLRSVGAILDGASTTSYCQLVRSKAEAGRPFVRFERAIVAQLKPEAALNREALERAVVDELRARYVVAGTQPQLEWKDDGAVRFVAQSLLEQGAAYSISGRYLVMASSREFASDILQASKSAGQTPESTDGLVDSYAVVRIAAAKPAFDILMSKLDGRNQGATTAVKGDDEQREVKFFSENISSLIAASGFREVRLAQKSGSITTQRASYLW
jgi:hypothetical protein